MTAVADVFRDDRLPADLALKADIAAWVGKLDAAVDRLYMEIDRLPGLVEGGQVNGTYRGAEEVGGPPQ